ncbi:hypothetical protein [uncultured Arthrobacter sp.]|uniref:hypothetical protein n=1 Tax=uncultured Arthrobacter sp. TaxID=114050 RepID=UPI00261E9A41|nr:hypothetical protein [uncultured Arthrobacter sp.]
MLAWRDGPLLTGVALVTLVPLLAGCRIEVPVTPGGNADTPAAPTAPAPAPTSSKTAEDASELPPLPRAEIVGNDMTLDRGAYIDEADTVAFSEAISRAPGWTPTRLLVNGESVYVSDAGCTTSLRSTPAQGPLLVDGDDRASTEALFRYLDPSILPEYLETTGWLWGASPGESAASIEFLTYTQQAAGDAPASAVSLRLFHATGTALVFSVSCPSDEDLAAAVTDLRSRVSVVPPG